MMRDAAAREPRSALAIEIDDICARAVLIERVDGRARIVSTGEAVLPGPGPSGDAATSARAAVAQIETATGRALFALGGLIVPRGEDGSGVDTAVLVVDAPARLRVVTLGDRLATASAKRALTQLLPDPGDPIDLRLGSDPADVAQRLRDAFGAPVDGVVVVGPGDAPALARLGQAISLLSPAPTVIWAGAAAGAETARTALAGRCELITVDPVRPAAEVEHLGPLREAATELWQGRIDRSLPGAETVARWVAGRVWPRRRGEDLAAAYLAEHHRASVWLAHLDAGAAELTHVESGAPRAVARARNEATPVDLARSIRPWAIDDSADTASARSERARAALRLAATHLPRERRPAESRGVALLVGSGAIALLPTEDALRTLLDGLEPAGLVQLVVDELGVLAGLGALAEAAPALAAGALDHDALRPLGAVVAPAWRAKPGQTAFRLGRAVPPRDGVVARSIPWELVPVAAEEIRRVRLGEDEIALLRVDRPHWWDPRRWLGRRLRTTVVGGPLGLLLDGRTRPTGGATPLGRERIGDDGQAARRLGDSLVVRPIVDAPALLRRTRSVPVDGRILVGPGDVVGPEEILAQRRVDAEHEIVPAGRLLGVADPRPFLVRPAGARVNAGDVIAERRALFGLVNRTVVAPISGTLSPELGGFGSVAIVGGEPGEGIAAHLPGVVVGTLPDNAVMLETTGVALVGAFGLGQEARGPLVLADAPGDASEGRSPVRWRGAVAVLDRLDRADLQKLRSLGAIGVIVGSVDPSLAAELVADGPPLAIVATEGIGDAPLPAEAAALLARQAGGLACLSPGDPADPRSQPELVIPVAVEGRPRPPAEPRLQVGARVRVVGGRIRIGRVAALPTVPLRTPAGLVTRQAEIDLDTGERIACPLANLELVA